MGEAKTHANKDTVESPIAELVQQQGWFGRGRYLLTETHVYVEEIRLLSRQSFTEVYINLSPDFSYIRRISTKSFVLSIVSLVVFISFFAISIQSLVVHTSAWKSCVAVAALAALLLLISLREIRDGSLNDIVFKHQYDGRQVFSIRRNSPSAMEVERFVSRLAECIREAEGAHEPVSLYGVAEELRSVAALREDGVITDAEYRELKSRLIGRKGEKDDFAELNLDSNEVN